MYLQNGVFRDAGAQDACVQSFARITNPTESTLQSALIEHQNIRKQ